MSTVLITGANRGIGLELTRALRARGDEVIAVCRSSSPDLESLGVRLEAPVDVTDDGAVGELAGRLNGVGLDLLIQNAGILLPDDLDRVDLEDVRRQWEVNALAPLRLTRALLPNLGSGAKLALMTSRMGSLADNTSGRMYGYRMSKAALNAAGVSLAHDLRPRGVAVAILHPGYVATEMTGFGGDVAPADAARRLLERIDELTLETTGTFWHASGERLPW